MKKKITKAVLKAREKRKNKKEFKLKLETWKKAVIERDNSICQKCGKNLNGINRKGKKLMKHPHHIISFEAVIHKYPQLLEDSNNGILLCSQCHKFSSDSAHEGGFEFTFYLMERKPQQYNYLFDKLKDNKLMIK